MSYQNNMATGTGKVGRGPRRVLSNLQKSIEEGNYYESHQMIRTLYARYMNQHKYQDAFTTVYDGATMLLKHDQEESGFDLCKLSLQCLEDSGAQVTDEYLDKINYHFQLFSPKSQNRLDYITEALSVYEMKIIIVLSERTLKSIDWTAKMNMEWPFGHPKLHLICAETYWREQDYGNAQYHFLHANNGLQCAAMLVECAVTSGYPSEADLFVCQAVLQFLCLKRSSTAHSVFSQYTEKHPDFSVSGPPYKKPLLNFLWILLIIIDRKGTVNQFTVLCEKYHPSLNRDPNYFLYLDKIGQTFFGVPPREEEPSLQNFFGNLLQNIASVGDTPEVSSTVETEDLD